MFIFKAAYHTELFNPLQITPVDFRDCKNLSYRLQPTGCDEISYEKARIDPKLKFL